MKMTVRTIDRPAKQLATAVSLAALLTTACGGTSSVASRSAAAYQEALKNGLPVGGGGHGGHPATDDTSMAGMDHSKMEEGGMTGMDHTKMKRGGMTGMEHTKMEQDGMVMGDPATAAIVTDTSAEPMSGKAAATLRPDPFDAPAATAIADAQRSADMADMMASEGHGAMSHGSYVHQDVGRDQATPQQQIDHSMHEDPERDQVKRESRSRHDLTNDSGGSQEKANMIYTCPMHPEVQSSTPGKCPKCGMTLVEREKR